LGQPRRGGKPISLAHLSEWRFIPDLDACAAVMELSTDSTSDDPVTGLRAIVEGGRINGVTLSDAVCGLYIVCLMPLLSTTCHRSHVERQAGRPS